MEAYDLAMYDGFNMFVLIFRKSGCDRKNEFVIRI